MTLSSLRGATTPRLRDTQLLDALNDRNPGVRQAAATTLGEHRDRRALKPLIERFADRYSVRLAAIDAVSRFGAAVWPLQAALDHDDVAVRAGALLALGRLRRWSVLPLLVEHRKDRHSAIRFAARRALLDFRPRAAPRLALFMGSTSVRLRAALVAILRDFGAVTPLVAGLDHPSPHTRADAARALGARGSHRAVPVLARLLDEERHPDVRRAAASALMELRGPASENHPALSHRDPRR